MPASLRIALVIIASAVVYLVGTASVALWDRDEPRNAQAARQMYQSGDWIVPRFLDDVRRAKPPFTYWLQASAMHAFGDTAFAARLPSVVAMTLTLIVLAAVLTRFGDGERAFWGVFILATSAIIIGFTAKASLHDAVLLLWVTIAQLCLYAIVRGHATWPVVLTFATSTALAGLTKGPIILGVQATTLLALGAMNWKRLVYGADEPRGFDVSDAAPERGTGRRPVSAAQPQSEEDRSAPMHGPAARATFVGATLRTIVAVAIITAIVLPWMYLVEQRDPGFIGKSVSHDVVRRTLEPLEQHKGPPGYYLLVIWGIYFPWSVFLPLTFVVAWRHRRSDPRVRFALAAIIGPWFMLELVQTKLPHYLLPVFPALAYLSADALVRCLRREHDDLITRGTRGAVAAWAIITALLGLGPWLALGRFDHLPIAAMVAFTLSGLFYALAVYVPFHLVRPRTGLIGMGTGMMVVMTIAWGWYFPRAHFLRMSACLADVLHRAGGGAGETRPGDVQMIGYKEPGLAFHQGGTIRQQSEHDFLATHPPEQWPAWTVIRDDVYQRMPPEVKDRLEPIGSCHGLAYSDRGRIVTVHVLRKRDR